MRVPSLSQRNGHNDPIPRDMKYCFPVEVRKDPEHPRAVKRPTENILLRLSPEHLRDQLLPDAPKLIFRNDGCVVAIPSIRL